MRSGSWGALAVVTLVCALAGCGEAPPRPAPRPPDLINVLHGSMMEGRHLRAAGLDPARDTGGVPVGQVNADPGRPCDGRLRSDTDRRLAVQWGYSSEAVQVVQQAFSYRHVSAADVVAQIRKTARRCDSYQTRSQRGDTTYTVDSRVRLPAVAGVDAAYAYCEEGRAEQWVWWVCHASLARGKVVTTLRVNAASRKQTRAVLTDLTPVAAHLLIRASGQP